MKNNLVKGFYIAGALSIGLGFSANGLAEESRSVQSKKEVETRVETQRDRSDHIELRSAKLEAHKKLLRYIDRSNIR